MKSLKKPAYLRPGDTVATVSPSSGIAGDPAFLPRYQLGKKMLEERYGLKVVEMPHTLSGSAYVQEHPKERAQDLMDAFADSEIKGIITCIGGEDNIRLTPYIDFALMSEHPKILTGISDITTTHFFCLKAGITSLYGGCLLSDFAMEEMHPYSAKWLEKMLFSSEIPGELPVSPVWCGSKALKMEAGQLPVMEGNTGYAILQGSQKVQGRLLGGCLEVLSSLRGTPLFPEPEEFENVILFLETSPLRPDAWFLEDFLRSLAASGILQRLSGILLAKPLDGSRQEEYHLATKKILAEYDLPHLPVLANASFGHNAPRACIPYGVLAELDCDRGRFSILESPVA